MKTTSIVINQFSRTLSFPTKEVPAWASLSDRWYQLDAYAYCLAETCFTLREHLKEPGLFILAGNHGSNETDYRFAQEAVPSPSKFVHSLPNVRASSLYQVMKWTGPILCVARDPQTFSAALCLAADEAMHQPEVSVLVACVTKVGSLFEVAEKSTYRVDLLVYQPNNTTASLPGSSLYRLERQHTALNSMNLKPDAEIFDWILGSSASNQLRFTLSSQHSLTRLDQ